MNLEPEDRTEQYSPNEEVHTRLLKFALGVRESTDYWANVSLEQIPVSTKTAFEEAWFGHASEQRVGVVLSNMRVRYDAFPPALKALSKWGSEAPLDARTLICHWHLQLADPLYREFTGSFLPEKRDSNRSSITRYDVIEWVEDQQPDRWKNATLTQWASKLLSAAESAGLIEGKRGDRDFDLPSVSDISLSYLLHLLRHIKLTGTILENPYLRSVGLTGRLLQTRIRRLDGIAVDQMGDLIDVRSEVDSVADWPEVFR